MAASACMYRVVAIITAVEPTAVTRGSTAIIIICSGTSRHSGHSWCMDTWSTRDNIISDVLQIQTIVVLYALEAPE